MQQVNIGKEVINLERHKGNDATRHKGTTDKAHGTDIKQGQWAMGGFKISSEAEIPETIHHSPC
jgi:hypothetical protein